MQYQPYLEFIAQPKAWKQWELIYFVIRNSINIEYVISIVGIGYAKNNFQNTFILKLELFFQGDV